ncbi:MAG: glycosyltransferase family 39 protein, partial [Bacteriovoracaceae bacterium]|nr:glycosyltransferase family 39 protein [Bacteriovoracaceae bacterium]
MKSVFKSIREDFSNIKLEGNYGLWMILLLGATLYFQQSWVPGFFQDGYLYTVFGKNAAELGHWLIPFQSKTQYPQFDHHPPFLFMIEGLFFKLFGSSYSSARIFSGSWSLATVLGVFLFFKDIKKPRWGFFSSLILILIPSLLKKTRFPNLDVPLMFCFFMSLSSYYLAVFNERKNNWYLCGFFTGLAFLIKGFPALVIIGIMFLHLLINGRINELKKFTPWIGLLLSVLIVSIWPMALYLKGDYQVFHNYVIGQFFNTIVKGRMTNDPQYFLYFTHLFKTVLPWLILAFLGWRKAIKNEDKSIFSLFLVWFTLILLPFSFVKFKYSNYIIPLYPALAIMAGYYLSKLKNNIQDKIY